ncbi:HAMP domain-containing sensor histidine kinase [Denitrificimonas sp. JX-1]|uniref:histidine kinase n=1 Tax=Denitrificimonas halotolerans TaxID=3098930 RepID=A0ABU5GTL0_9GAMM|nr:HAMP domain-containing sensor histidine kinase [Denitrificimonas sp. JX-1]MDY7218968.1 HAMP domain-containing sensor histidine kinase [Denitrificimonas sp. JX-1]
MGSLFWRVFGSFWLALMLTGVLTFLLIRTFNQDNWILNHHPGLKNFAATWLSLYETGATDQAQTFLQQQHRQYRIHTQILDENTISLTGTPPSRILEREARYSKHRQPWRRITEEITSNHGQTYLLIYRIPYSELGAWQRSNALRPMSALLIALFVLSIMSMLLTLSITRPLNRLRHAVHDLAHTSYHQEQLSQLAQRRDEFGVLASDFNTMGQRLQGLISNQRQLLRDVSHELRSPLARLQIALALAERGTEEQRRKLWPRLQRECERLDALIDEILTLARLDQVQTKQQSFAITPLLTKLIDDAALLQPNQIIAITGIKNLTYQGWPELLQRAIDNLLRNALRFNPAGLPIEVHITRQDNQLSISVRDQGPGVSDEWLAQLGHSFFRVPGQNQDGYGLGLTIAQRAVEKHNGQLELNNHPQGGFIATIKLPLSNITS